MPSTSTILGTLSQYVDPHWEPLHDLVGVDLAGWFMWMFEIELADQSRVQAYKHVSTRRYFHLAEDGRAFAYKGEGRYVEIDRRDAIDAAFDGWEEVLPEGEDAAVVRDALRRARVAAGTVRSRREGG